MKEEFDLEKQPKGMPYRVPAGFFEGVTQATLQEAKRREAADTTKPNFLGSWKVWSVAASILVLVVAGYFLLNQPQSTAPALATVTAPENPKTAPAPAAEPVVEVPVLPETTREPQKIRKEPPAPNQRREAPAAKPTQQEAKPESLEKLLATLTDEEVAELASMATTETLATEETIEP